MYLGKCNIKSTKFNVINALSTMLANIWTSSYYDQGVLVHLQFLGWGNIFPKVSVANEETLDAYHQLHCQVRAVRRRLMYRQCESLTNYFQFYIPREVQHKISRCYQHIENYASHHLNIQSIKACWLLFSSLDGGTSIQWCLLQMKRHWMCYWMVVLTRIFENGVWTY